MYSNLYGVRIFMRTGKNAVISRSFCQVVSSGCTGDQLSCPKRIVRPRVRESNLIILFRYSVTLCLVSLCRVSLVSPPLSSCSLLRDIKKKKKTIDENTYSHNNNRKIESIPPLVTKRKNVKKKERKKERNAFPLRFCNRIKN